MGTPSPGYAVTVHGGQAGLDPDRQWIAGHTLLASPGLFRGMLDAAAREITDEVMLAAAPAVAAGARAAATDGGVGQ